MEEMNEHESASPHLPIDASSGKKENTPRTFHGISNLSKLQAMLYLLSENNSVRRSCARRESVGGKALVHVRVGGLRGISWMGTADGTCLPIPGGTGTITYRGS